MTNLQKNGRRYANLIQVQVGAQLAQVVDVIHLATKLDAGKIQEQFVNNT